MTEGDAIPVGGPTRIVLATANPAKARELAEVLTAAHLDVELVARPPAVPEVAETGVTLEDNARLKARALARATGLLALADDTGLEVDVLGGAPGVRSARYAGDHATDAENVARLRAEIDAAAALGAVVERRARFVTVVVVAGPDGPDGPELVARGEVTGHIAREPRGSNGFGYDPVFVPDEGDGRTFAQMRPEEKHALSHRGRAVRAIAVRLRESAMLSARVPSDGFTRSASEED